MTSQHLAGANLLTPDKVLRLMGSLTLGRGKFAGQKFHVLPFQDQLTRDVFGLQELTPGEVQRRYQEAAIWVSRKNGKGLALDTPLPTPTGWTTMGEVEPGDQLLDDQGAPTTVTFTSEVHHLDCYRVAFADGAVFVADGDHQWTFHDRSTGQERTVDTRTLAAEGIVYGARGDRRYRVPAPPVLQLPEAELPLDPYVLGVWLGDGAQASGRVSSGDPQVFGELARRWPGGLGPDTSGPDRVETRTLYGLVRELDRWGLRQGKSVPAEYLRGSERQRLDLLRGLMDSDGTAGQYGRGVSFCSTTWELAEAVAELARSLGWKPTVREGRSRLRGEDLGPKWTVQWNAYADRSPFLLERKSARLRQRPSRAQRSATRSLVSVERVRTVPTRCLQVDSPTSLFLAGETFTPTHNTALVAAWALALLTEEPGGEVLGVAAKRDQAALMMDAAKRYVRDSAIGGVPLSEFYEVRRNAIYYRPMDAVYRTISSDASSEHGANPHAVVADELHAWRDPELLYAMTTATAARANPLVVYISTPGERPSGVWWDLWEKSLAAERGELNDPRFYARVFTAPEGCDLKDEDAIRAANPALGHVIPLDYFHRQADTLPEYVYRRLHLCQPTTASERWLPLAAWQACEAQPELEKGAPVYVALDAALGRDTFAVSLVHLDAEGVFHVRAWAFRPDQDGGYVDPRDVEAMVLGLARQYRIRGLAYDPAFMGLLASSLQDAGVKCHPYPQTGSAMVRATETLQRAVLDGKVRHGGDRELTRQVGNVVVRESERGVRISKGKSNDHVDLAVALAMAMDTAEQASRNGARHFVMRVDPKEGGK